LLAAAALSFELGAVTSANSHPVVPFAGFETAEGCCSTAENHHQQDIIYIYHKTYAYIYSK